MLAFLKTLFITMLSLTGLFNIGFTQYDEPIDPENGGDPFIVEDEGNYYYIYTTGAITIRRIAGLHDAAVLEEKTVYTEGSDGIVRDIWAPEIHKIGDRWYIVSCAVFDSASVPRGYRTQGDSGDDHPDYYRYGFVLESKTEDIFGEYEFKGRLAPDGFNNIDGTYMHKDGKLYYVSSTYDCNAQNISICEMENPYTLKADENGKNNTVFLSSPEYSWERKGWLVNEGPAVLYNENDIRIVYSASGYSSGEYCMGMLTLTGDDVTNAGHWSKSIIPVRYHLPQSDIYSAGHCSFHYSDDGSVWMVYHANRTKEFSARLTFVKPVRYICGTPVF